METKSSEHFGGTNGLKRGDDFRFTSAEADTERQRTNKSRVVKYIESQKESRKRIMCSNGKRRERKKRVFLSFALGKIDPGPPFSVTHAHTHTHANQGLVSFTMYLRWGKKQKGIVYLSRRHTSRAQLTRTSATEIHDLPYVLPMGIP